MRRALLAAALIALAAPVPALAQDAEDSGLAEAVDAMSDPAMQEQVSLMAAMMVGALLEMPVGPLAEAAAEMAGDERPAIDPDARVRDLMGPAAAEAPERVAERLPQMMGAMAVMAGAFEDMLPELRAMGERLQSELPRNLPRN